MAITKARQLAELIANSLVDSDEISVGAVTTSKLADTLDFSSKTMVMADNQLSGDKIHGGTVSAFSSTGIDDNASSTAVTILSSGNVGIGATSPNSKLTVSAGSGGTILELNRSNTNTTGTVGAISFTASDGHVVSAINVVGDGDNEGGDIQFRTTSNASGTNYYNDTDVKMTIQSDGNVGIGETNPDFTADVTHQATGQTDVMRLKGYTGNAFVRFQDNDNSSDWTFGADDNSGLGSGALIAYDRNNTAYRWGLDSSGNLYLGTTTSSGHKVNIRSDQDTGIVINTVNTRSGSGTSTMLNLTNDTDTDIQFVINEVGAGTKYASIGPSVSGRALMLGAPNGNVGIGTTSPQAKLHVYNENGGNATDKATMLSEAVLKLQPHTTNSTNLLVAQVNGGNGIGLQVTNGPATANWDLALSPFGGDVGIGTDSPVAKLDVIGKITAGFESGYTGSSDAGGHIRATFASNNTAQGGLVIGGGGTTDDNHSIWFRVGKDNTVDTTSYYQYGEHRFYTGGTIDNQSMRMKIDSAGRVTTPYQPYFLANNYGQAKASGWQQIVFTTNVPHNVGGHYNASNSRFTAPVAGVYLFSVGGYIQANNSTERYAFSFYVNNGGGLYIGGGTQAAVDAPIGTLTQSIKLNANDYVTVHMYTPAAETLGASYHRMWFNGSLLG